MSKNVQRYNPRNNNPYLAVGVIALALVIPSAIMAFFCGIALLLAYENFLVIYGQCAGCFVIVAAMLSVTSVCLVIVAIVKNKKFAVASAFLSLTATLIVVCSLGVTGFDYDTVLWPEIISIAAVASALSLTSFILLAVYYAKAPIKTVYFNRSLKNESIKQIDLTLKRIALLNKLYDDGILTADEFSVQKKKLLAELNKKNDDTDKNDGADGQNFREVSLPKNRILRLILVPVLILIIVCGGTVTGLQFACCETVYSEIEYEMSHMSQSLIYNSYRLDYKIAYLLYDMLPYDYKDVDRIRSEYRYYGISEYLGMKGHYQTTGYEIREVYKRLVKYKEQGRLDQRWDLSNILVFCKELLYSATWSYGYHYIQFQYTSQFSNTQSFYTNLPDMLPDDYTGNRYYYISYNDGDLENGEITIGYYIYGVEYDSYGISNFAYDVEINAFSVDVYCYADDTTYPMTMV